MKNRTVEEAGEARREHKPWGWQSGRQGTGGEALWQPERTSATVPQRFSELRSSHLGAEGRTGLLLAFTETAKLGKATCKRDS